VLAGFFFATAVKPTESWGLGLLVGPVIVSPMLFAIGLVFGFFAGAVREWFHPASEWRS
jgi:hypothetical protein